MGAFRTHSFTRFVTGVLYNNYNWIIKRVTKLKRKYIKLTVTSSEVVCPWLVARVTLASIGTIIIHALVFTSSVPITTFVTIDWPFAATTAVTTPMSRWWIVTVAVSGLFTSRAGNWGPVGRLPWAPFTMNWGLMIEKSKEYSFFLMFLKLKTI